MTVMMMMMMMYTHRHDAEMKLLGLVQEDLPGSALATTKEEHRASASSLAKAAVGRVARHYR